MAEITLRLRFNLETGKKDIYIDFVSDDDSLPMEHEQDHREIVEDLIGQGVLSRGRKSPCQTRLSTFKRNVSCPQAIRRC